MPPYKRPASLLPREARFCAEYLVDFNGTKAATRAGYSAKTAAAAGSRLLKKVNIKNEVDRRKGLAVESAQLSGARVLAEVQKIALSNFGRFLVLDEAGRLVPDFSRIGPDDMAAISSIELAPIVAGPRRGKPRGKRRKAKGKAVETAGGAERSYVSKIRLWDKPKSLELLGRHFKLWLPDDTPPPPPNDDRRKMVVNVLVQVLERKAAAAHAGVTIEGALSPARPAVAQAEPAPKRAKSG